MYRERRALCALAAIQLSACGRSMPHSLESLPPLRPASRNWSCTPVAVETMQTEWTGEHRVGLSACAAALAYEGTFSWLPELAPHSSPLAYADELGGITEAHTRLEQLQREAHTRALALPEPFVRFMTTPRIHSRVPSVTGGYLDLSASLLDVLLEPSGPLIRFMRDSQDCVAWYLQLTRHGRSPVVATWHLRDNAQDELVPDEGRAHVMAPDFETFVHRFWLENLLWLKLTRHEPLLSLESDYLAAAHGAVSLLQSPTEDGLETSG